MATAPVDSPVAELRALSDIIKISVDRIEALCAERGQTFPLSDLPFTPQSEVPRANPEVVVEGKLIVAAAAQLLAAVRPPSLSLVTHAVQVGSELGNHRMLHAHANQSTVTRLILHSRCSEAARSRNTEGCRVQGTCY